MGDRMYAVAAILTSVACVGAFVYFLPDVKPELLPDSRLNTFVKIRDEIGGKNAEIGVDELSDYSPLFLPTRWNYGRNAYSPDYKSMSEPKAIRATYAVPLENKSIVLEKDDIESAKTGLYRSIMRSVFSGFGRNDSKSDIIAERSALIKVVDMSSGKTVKRVYANPNTDGIMISPAEFLVDVFNGGLASRPLLLKSSGSDSNDAAIVKFIAKKSIFRELGNGQYKVMFTF